LLLTGRLFSVTSNLVISTKSFWTDSRFSRRVNSNDKRETIYIDHLAWNLEYLDILPYWNEPSVNVIDSGAMVASDNAWVRHSYFVRIWLRVFPIWVAILRWRNTGTWWNYHKVASKKHATHSWAKSMMKGLFHFTIYWNTWSPEAAVVPTCRSFSYQVSWRSS